MEIYIKMSFILYKQTRYVRILTPTIHIKTEPVLQFAISKSEANLLELITLAVVRPSAQRVKRLKP